MKMLHKSCLCYIGGDVRGWTIWENPKLCSTLKNIPVIESSVLRGRKCVHSTHGNVVGTQLIIMNLNLATSIIIS